MIDNSALFMPAASQNQSICHRELSSPAACTIERLSDGTSISTNEGGDIVFASYANGSKVKRYEDYIMVLSNNGGYWMGDQEGRWFPLD